MLYIYIYIYIYIYMIRPGFHRRSNHTKNLKMILNTSLLSTQHYKVRIKGKMEQSREGRRSLPYILLKYFKICPKSLMSAEVSDSSDFLQFDHEFQFQCFINVCLGHLAKFQWL